MNTVHLLGRICKDFDLKTVGDKNTENCSFTIAVDRKYKSADGTRPADFLTVVCWGALAKFAHSYFQKGSRILVIGTIQSRSYDKEGAKVYVVEIVAEQIEFVDAKKSESETWKPSAEQSAPAVNNSPEYSSDTFLPFDL